MSFDTARFEEGLERIKAEHKIAGLAAALTDRDSVIFEKGLGVTSVEKPWDAVRPDTLFRIASNTKFTVGLCAMQLAEKGLLDLDAPVKNYLPWFNFRGEEFSARVTARALLSHTAGLPAEYTADGFRDEDRAEAVLMSSLREAENSPAPEPGQYLYSNFGVRIVACAIEHILGKRFSAVDKELVLDPLGMRRTTFDVCEAITFQPALPHERDADGNPVLKHYFPINAARYAAGGLFSTVQDMAALARVKLNRGRPLISPESWAQMTQPLGDMRELDGFYGLTLMMRRFCGRTLFGHTGSNPPFYSCVWVLPEAGLGVAFAENTEGGRELTNRAVPELFLSCI